MSILTQKKFGVYEIVFHTDSGDMVYIGSTTQPFRKRLWQHSNLLKRNIHWNAHLQCLWNKYRHFDFNVLEICSNPNEVTIREQWHIDHADKSTLVNFGPAIPNPKFGHKVSEETRSRMSKAQKGRKVSETTLKKLSEVAKGRPKSPEELKKIIASLLGRPCTPETRAKLSAANKGKKPSTKAIEAARRSHLGTKATPELREKLSAAQKIAASKKTPEERSAIKRKAWLSRSRKGKPLSEEAKAKLHQAARDYHARKRAEK